MNKNPIKLTLKALFAFFVFTLLTNCGIWDPADARKISPSAQDRAEKNLKEGKGFRLNQALKNKGSGSFEFATSNEMWRATLSLLDFTPLSNVDYSGGIIITEWFNDKSSSCTSDCYHIVIKCVIGYAGEACFHPVGIFCSQMNIIKCLPTVLPIIDSPESGEFLNMIFHHPITEIDLMRR